MSVPPKKADTRGKIQSIALELFAEQGYEKTSLREIAERLGVTKAALYYHFKTKEDIVSSLFEDFRAEVDEIIEWAGGQEMNDDTRMEVLRRYAAVLDGPGEQVIQFVQGNQSTMRDLRDATQMFERFKALIKVLTSDSTSVRTELRTTVALFTLHFSRVTPFEMSGTKTERLAEALEIASELVSGQPPNRVSTSAAVSPKSASS